MLYRYELYVDGEYQGVGILQGLDDMFSSDRAHGLVWPFNRELKVPPYSQFNGKLTASFFTEKGREKFKDSIAVVKTAYEEETCFEVRELTIEQADIAYAVLWEDEDQVIVLDSAVKRE